MVSLVKRSPSIRTVAERAGVSTATVSNVLNGKAVSPDFVARVKAAVEELGYVADPHASRLRSGRHALAAVVVPDLANPMFGAFVSRLESLARRDGYDLLVVSSANAPAEEAERLRAIRSWRPAGLIVIPCDGDLAARLPGGGNPPIVVADRIPDAPRFDLVAVDNAQAAGQIAAHLKDQGFRSCLVVGTSLAISNVRERWDGAVAAAGAMAMRLLEVGLDPIEVRRRLEVTLNARSRPAALFTLDHGTTLVAYQLLADLGLRVPEDVALASFDETEWMRLVEPPLTAVRQPVEAMAAAAWAQLLRRMKGDTAVPAALRLDCAVTLRGSTRHLPRPGKVAA
jgi:LacI family transcriptional regulator